MSDPAHYSDLDTRRFGKRIYRADVRTAADLNAIENLAAAEEVDMMIVRCPAGEIRTVHALEASGYLLMDTLVYYTGPPRAFDGAAPAHAVRRATVGDREGLEAVASDAFRNYDGHYHADPRLNPSLATLGYVDWCLSSLDAKDHTVWVATERGAVTGFLAVKHEGGTARITLNAVAPAYQRRGIYDSLFKVAGEALLREGTRELVVSTHVNNLAPQKVWVRNGLRPASVSYTFHKWFSE
jgi:ribosomal protein S18 acetylase RimI-like enzyme